MIFKDVCVLVIWTKVASALRGYKAVMTSFYMTQLLSDSESYILGDVLNVLLSLSNRLLCS